MKCKAGLLVLRSPGARPINPIAIRRSARPVHQRTVPIALMLLKVRRRTSTGSHNPHGQTAVGTGEVRGSATQALPDTGLHRNTITLLYQETSARIELDTLDKLCKYFGVGVAELFEYVADSK